MVQNGEREVNKLPYLKMHKYPMGVGDYGDIAPFLINRG